MTSGIARLRLLWLALIPALVLSDVLLRRFEAWHLPIAVLLTFLVGLVGLSAVTPRPQERAPADLLPPVRGRWSTLNGPGSKVPSHGTNGYGQRYAVDLVMATGSAAPPLVGRALLPDKPDDYPCFGADVVSMAAGTVLRVHDAQRDHRCRNTWPALIFMMTIEAVGRSLGGFRAIAGNRIIIAHDDGTFAAYAHLQRGSALVRVGEKVTAGQPIARVGNTGNTSEPHLHVQLMERASPGASAGIPMRWPSIEVTGDDPRLAPWVKPPHASAMPTFPPNGSVFQTHAS